jgi:hypothetical protein
VSALNPGQLDDAMARLAAGNTRVLSRAVTLVENGERRGMALLERVYASAPHPWVIGFTGAGGAGKSTLVPRVAEHFAAQGEFAANGVRVLIAHAFAPFQMVTTKNFDGLQGLEGRKLRSLGAGQQKALLAAGEAATRNGCEFADKAVVPSAEKPTAAGVKIAPLLAADDQTVKAVLATVGDEWAADLDRRGKPGTEVLKAFREAVR